MNKYLEKIALNRGEKWLVENEDRTKGQPSTVAGRKRSDQLNRAQSNLSSRFDFMARRGRNQFRELTGGSGSDPLEKALWQRASPSNKSNLKRNFGPNSLANLSAKESDILKNIVPNAAEKARGVSTSIAPAVSNLAAPDVPFPMPDFNKVQQGIRQVPPTARPAAASTPGGSVSTVPRVMPGRGPSSSPASAVIAQAGVPALEDAVKAVNPAKAANPFLQKARNVVGTLSRNPRVRMAGIAAGGLAAAYGLGRISERNKNQPETV